MDFWWTMERERYIYIYRIDHVEFQGCTFEWCRCSSIDQPMHLLLIHPAYRPSVTVGSLSETLSFNVHFFTNKPGMFVGEVWHEIIKILTIDSFAPKSQETSTGGVTPIHQTAIWVRETYPDHPSAFGVVSKLPTPKSSKMPCCRTSFSHRNCKVGESSFFETKQ